MIECIYVPFHPVPGRATAPLQAAPYSEILIEPAGDTLELFVKSKGERRQARGFIRESVCIARDTRIASAWKAVLPGSLLRYRPLCMDKNSVDPASLKARKLFKQSKKSLDKQGNEMGLEGDVARKSAWQFLIKVKDPKLSTLRRFAKAMGISVKDLV